MPAATDAEDPLLGRLIAGKFRVEEQLGAGAMGRVYRAEQINLGKRVALKVLQASIAGDPALGKRFHREARHASQLAHPNILSIIDFGDDEGLLYIAMELLTGRDLYKVIRAERPFAPERIGHLVGQVLGALDEAHARGIVHRDLKPENVMLTDVRGEPDFVKVCDFGIAKAITDREGDGSLITVAGAICGTPEYMSPEQARGEALDGRSDLYAAAVILYQMASGEVPFRAESALGVITKHLTEAPVPPSQRRPGVSVPPALEALILRGLEKNREQRFANAAEMKQALFEAVGIERRGASSSSSPRLSATEVDLARAATGVAAPASSPAFSTSTSTGARRPGGVVLGGALALLLAVGGVVWWRAGSSPPQNGATPPVRQNAAGTAVGQTATGSEVRHNAADPGVRQNTADQKVRQNAAAPSNELAPIPLAPVAAPSLVVAAKAPARERAHHHEHAAPAAVAALLPGEQAAGGTLGPRAGNVVPAAAKPAAVAVAAAPAAAVAPGAPAAPAAPPAAAHGFAALFAEGEALFRGGTIDAALASYQEAARLNPSDAKTQRQIGKCYNRLGQRDRAQPYLRRYLELAPDAPDAAFVRAMVDCK